MYTFVLHIVSLQFMDSHCGSVTGQEGAVVIPVAEYINSTSHITMYLTLTQLKCINPPPPSMRQLQQDSER